MEEKFEDSSDMRKSLLTTQGDYFASNCLQSFERIHYPVNEENKFRKGRQLFLVHFTCFQKNQILSFPHFSQFLSVCLLQAAPSFPVSEATTLSLATTERHRSRLCSQCTTHSCCTTTRCHVIWISQKISRDKNGQTKFCLDCRRNRKGRQGKAGLSGREGQG